MSYNIIGIFGFGIAFAIFGVLAVVRKRIVFHFGRFGRGYASIPVRISGTSAIIFGGGLLVGGLVMVLPIIRAYILNRVAADDTTLNTIGVVGALIVAAALGFSLILQAAMALGENIKKSRDQR